MKDGSTATITGGTITSDADGANGVFSYGGNGGQNGASGDGTTVIITVALFAHGYASIIVSDHLEFDEKRIAQHLERTWNGAVLAAAQEE